MDNIKNEIKKRTLSYVMAAFGLVAGLAWNEAIKGLIEFIFPLGKSALLGKFIYAILVTLIVVFVTMYLSRLLQKE